MKNVMGKVAVVTGAASGIGRGMAQSFAAAGMKVVLSDVEEQRLAATCGALRASGADVHAVVTDVSKPEQVSALAQESMSHYGAVHVLCNNAGVGTTRRPSWSAPLEDWTWVLGVNLMGVVHGSAIARPSWTQRRQHSGSRSIRCSLTESTTRSPTV